MNKTPSPPAQITYSPTPVENNSSYTRSGAPTGTEPPTNNAQMTIFNYFYSGNYATSDTSDCKEKGREKEIGQSGLGFRKIGTIVNGETLFHPIMREDPAY